MTKGSVESAANKLEFRDLVLHDNALIRAPDIEPLLYPYTIEQRSQLKVKVEQLGFFDSDDEKIPILRAYIHFRVSGHDDSKRDSNKERSDEPLFSIQATFRVDYLIKQKLTKSEIDVFSKYNAVHNVWPFWRQHVFYMVNNAKLPRVTVPLFRRPPDVAKPKRSPRKKPVRQ
jgi:hypothetical protein